MSSTEILLNPNTTEEEKYKNAYNIITQYDLPLTIEQIMLAFQKIRGCINLNKNDLNKNCVYKNRLFVMSELLEQNINMYIAIILGLNNNLSVVNMRFLIKFRKIGADNIFSFKDSIYPYYCKLLDHYDFDVSNLDMSNEQKNYIKEYRDSKYNGKMIKSATKKN